MAASRPQWLALTLLLAASCCLLPGPVQGRSAFGGAKTVVDILTNNGLTTLLKAIEVAGLTDALNDVEAEGTLFAPTDKAFSDFLSSANITAAELLNDTDSLIGVLQFHLLPKAIRSNAFKPGKVFTTVLDAEGAHNITARARTKIAGELAGNHADIVKKDLFTSTGKAVVNIIDTVLLPVVADKDMKGSGPETKIAPLDTNTTSNANATDGGFGSYNNAGPDCKVCINIFKPINGGLMPFTTAAYLNLYGGRPGITQGRAARFFDSLLLNGLPFYQPTTFTEPNVFGGSDTTITVCIDASVIHSQIIMSRFNEKEYANQAWRYFGANGWACGPRINPEERIESTTGSYKPWQYTADECGLKYATWWYRQC